MIKQENPNFLASVYAPNPMEVTYWIDLSTDANGNVIKSYTGNDWLPVNYFTNTDQSVEIKKLKQEIADEVNRAKQAEQKLTNDLRQVMVLLMLILNQKQMLKLSKQHKLNVLDQLLLLLKL